jgi:photosystem II stability/assembly factor-like uncharacterized protein
MERPNAPVTDAGPIDMNRRILHTALLAIALMAILVTDGSAQWRRAAGDPGIFYNEAFFVDNDHGWITQNGPTVMRTLDGGATWLRSTLPGGGQSFNRDICFLDRNLGFISGEDGVWKTFDGGATWIIITPSDIPGNILGSVWFINANVGVCGFGSCDGNDVTFCRTLDGGQSWSRVSYTSSTDVAVGGITYQNGKFYAAGGEGKFWTSSDNGARWVESNTGSNGWQEDLISANGILFTASATGNSCGALGSGNIMRSVDNGRTWLNRFFPGVVMWGVTMYSPSEGWCCGDGGKAYKTTDGGLSWVEKSCGLDPNGRVDDIYFSDATHGWAVGNGIYQYTVSVTDAGNDVTICAGESTQLHGVGTGFFRWSPSAGLSCNGCTDPVVTPTKTTTYYLSVSGQLGCEGVDSVTVTVVPPPKVQAGGDSTICAGESVTLSASGGATYSWSPAATLSCSDCPNPVARPAATTRYVVKVSNGNDCFVTDTVVVNVNRVDADAGPDSAICVGQSVKLTATGGVAYSWHPSPDLSCTACREPVASPSRTSTYLVDVVGANGCVATDSVTVVVVPLPKPGLGNEVVICQGEATQLNDESGAGRYHWTPSDGLSCTDCPNPVASPDRTTTYYLTATNANGCQALDSITVVVRPITLQFPELPGGVFSFDTTVFTSSTCRDLVMKNTGVDPIVISSPWLLRNLEFSVPPSQFPIIIPPGQERRMTVCYIPSADVEQRDTLVVPTECTRRVPVVAYGKRFDLSDGVVCDTKIRVGGLGAAGQILKLAGPSPNPISTSRVAIEFIIARDGHARLDVHNALGQRVATVVDGELVHGKHDVAWDATEMPSGLYYCTLVSEEESVTSTIYIVR